MKMDFLNQKINVSASLVAVIALRFVISLKVHSVAQNAFLGNGFS